MKSRKRMRYIVAGLSALTATTLVSTSFVAIHSQVVVGQTTAVPASQKTPAVPVSSGTVVELSIDLWALASSQKPSEKVNQGIQLADDFWQSIAVPMWQAILHHYQKP